MVAILAWDFVVGGSEHSAERVELHDDGSVLRRVSAPPMGASVAFGWWRGSVDASVTGAGEALASPESEWSSGSPSPLPPAGGGWWASRPDGVTVPLWATGERSGELSALLSECVTAATEADAAADASASAVEDDEAAFLLALSSIGTRALELRLTVEGAAKSVAFMTDEGEVLGYAASSMELPAGAAVSGVVRGSQPARSTGAGMAGVMRRAGGDAESTPFNVRVKVGEPLVW